MQGWKRRAERVVLLQSQGQEIPYGHSHQQSNDGRFLEGHRKGQADLCEELPRRDEEDTGFLQGPGAEWTEIRLDHARVSPGDQRKWISTCKIIRSPMNCFISTSQCNDDDACMSASHRSYYAFVLQHVQCLTKR